MFEENDRCCTTPNPFAKLHKTLLYVLIASTSCAIEVNNNKDIGALGMLQNILQLTTVFELSRTHSLLSSFSSSSFFSTFLFLYSATFNSVDGALFWNCMVSVFQCKSCILHLLEEECGGVLSSFSFRRWCVKGTTTTTTQNCALDDDNDYWQARELHHRISAAT